MRQVSHWQPRSLRGKRRVELACTVCRAKKSRCDGQRPSCSTCARGGLSCTYEKPGDTRSQASTTTRRQLGLRSLDSSTTANALSSTFSCEAESAGKDVNQQAVDTLTISSSEGINQPNICHFGPTSNHALFRILSGIFIEYTAAKSNSWVSTIDNGNSTRTSSQVSPRPNINIAQDGKRL
ncbi:hypothetical protein F5Y08DRAFT_302757 [Xylaria arbuscula]|nr:hypothetical protein F5Y08DRAFT_302757 [Xylaria arbuscula]